MAISTLAGSASGRSAKSAAISGARLEIMLRRQPAAVLVGDEAALGDGEQRVVRLVIVGLGEKRLVRRDDRHAAAVGELDELGLDGALVFEAVALDLDVEPVAEGILQDIEAALREFGMAADPQGTCRGGRRSRPSGRSGRRRGASKAAPGRGSARPARA